MLFYTYLITLYTIVSKHVLIIIYTILSYTYSIQLLSQLNEELGRLRGAVQEEEALTGLAEDALIK